MLTDKAQPQRAITSVKAPRQGSKGALAHLVGRRRRIFLLIGDNVRWVSAAELPVVLAIFPDADDIVAWSPQRFRTNTTHRLENLDTICYFVVDLDNVPVPLEDLSEELRRRGFPEPWAIFESPSREGAHLYWKVRPLYVGGPRPGETLEAARERRERGLGLYRAAAEAVVKALQDLGADPNCTSPTQLFRLNNTRVIFTSQRKTSLSELLVAARAHLRQRGRRRSRPRTTLRPRFVSTAKHAESIWDSPGIRWLRERVIPQGCRNSAVVALSIALFHDGRSETQVYATVADWATDHTAPTYPPREIRDTVRSLARRWARGEPLGLDPQKLLAICDQNGQNMAREDAFATKRALVAKTQQTSRPKPPRKPLALRQKRPRIAWVPYLLKDQAHKIPKTTRTRLRRVYTHVNHLRCVAKRSYLLMCLGRQQTIIQIAKAGLWPTEAHSINSVHFWARSEPEFWVSLLGAVDEFLSAILGHRGRFAASRGEAPGGVEDGLMPKESGKTEGSELGPQPTVYNKGSLPR